MNNKKRVFNTFIKKYIPDFLIIFGFFVFSLDFFGPRRGGILVKGSSYLGWEYRVFAVVVIAIGVDVIIRRYIKFKNK